MFILVLVFWSSLGLKETQKEYASLSECLSAFEQAIEFDRLHLMGGNLMVEFSGCERK
jgi:hypothetical protein